jgi:hypothetical protein
MKKLVLALSVSAAFLAFSTVSAIAQGTKFEPVKPTDVTTDDTLPPNPCSQAVTTSCCDYKYVKVVKYGCFGKKHYKIVKVGIVTDSTLPGDTQISGSGETKPIGVMAAPLPDQSGALRGK